MLDISMCNELFVVLDTNVLYFTVLFPSYILICKILNVLMLTRSLQLVLSAFWLSLSRDELGWSPWYPRIISIPFVKEHISSSIENDYVCLAFVASAVRTTHEELTFPSLPKLHKKWKYSYPILPFSKWSTSVISIKIYHSIWTSLFSN